MDKGENCQHECMYKKDVQNYKILNYGIKKLVLIEETVRLHRLSKAHNC